MCRAKQINHYSNLHRLTLTINGPKDKRKTDNPATANIRNRRRENEVHTGVPSVDSQSQSLVTTAQDVKS